MTLDSASQTFNTGPPQYAASEITVSISEIRQARSGMEVVIRLVNQIRNERAFFPRYTVTVTVGERSKKKETDVFPNQPRELVFSFDVRDPVEVEADPGRNVESLFLSADLPNFANIQEPKTTIDVSPQTATVTYTVSNTGGQTGTTTVQTEVTGQKVRTKTRSQEKTVPPNTDISDSVTFGFRNKEPLDVQICVEKK